MSGMKIRIISSVVALIILVPVVIFSGTIVLPIAVAIVSLMGVFEMLRCCGVHKKYLFAIPYYIVAVVSPVLIYCTVKGILGLPLEGIFLLALLALVIWTYPCAIFSKGALVVTDATTASIGAIYVIAGLNSIVYIRQVVEAGGYVFVLVFIGAWVTDTAAYFCGRAFGKHRLIPDVSPKKTVEGSIGGVIFCTLCYVLYGILVQFVFGKGEITVHYVALVICGVVISIISQVGDLAMSLLKRHYGIKDFGKIMPGHGGVLDRFDSILAVATTLLICCAISGIVAGNGVFELASTIL